MSQYFNQTSNPEYSGFIHLSRYARWNPELGRRETWEETVDRYITFMSNRAKEKGAGPQYIQFIEEACREAILTLNVMPSMRAMMTAGAALERSHVAGFNCSYVAVDHYRAFDEILYILMCGTGVGFSVERQYINQLPRVPDSLQILTDPPIRVEDSKEGWAESYRELIESLYNGYIPTWDLSKIRPAGARLKTFGGRASGPEPLHDLFEFTIEKFKGATGRKLNSLEVHDIVCKIADIVVVGGVRRSALISLSNLSDDRMRHAKSGNWWEHNVQRALANNSVAYTEKPDIGIFMEEWQSLYESKSGERGIFNREASVLTAERNGRRDLNYEFGTNPCSEIILRSKQFCNLSEVVVRSDDTYDELVQKVRVATVLGTLQATLTDFPYLRDEWKENTDEEALLGVSLTGIMDHPVLSGEAREYELPKLLEELKSAAVETNKGWADTLGINRSSAITCVKPSGTVSQLVDSASGIHPRHSHWYIRTVRADKKDPLAQFMVDKGFPVEDDVTKPDHNYVFSFPIEAPNSSVFRNDRSAIEQLELWKIYQEHWCEHKPSITVYVKEDEWLEVGAWVYKNFDSLSGVSFLPYDGGSYRQAPYQEVTEEVFKEFQEKMPKGVDWTQLGEYEQDDNTIASQEMACTAGVCEIVDVRL